MANDRRKLAYEEATSLTQTMLDETFRGGENQIEAIGILTKTVGATTYTLRFADRPKFVGNNWYEGRAHFPQVKRTMGELQAPSIKFSQFEVRLANMDGFYNQYLEGGADYFSPIGARLQIQIGLRDEAASFRTVFDGFIPEEDGFEVDRQEIIFRATDKFNDLNRRSPLPFINDTDFPSAPVDSIGKIIPMVLGDWEAGYSVTAGAASIDLDDSGNTRQVIVDAPNGFHGGVVGYYVGGGYFVFSIGTYTPDNITYCHIKRGENLLRVNFNATPQNTAGYWSVSITSLVHTSGTMPYTYQNGDVAVIGVKVPYAVGDYDNVIEIAEQMLFTLGEKVSGELDSTSWTTYKTKNTPAQSDFTSIKGRLWVGEDKETVLGLVLGYLEAVRMEMFIDNDGKIALASLHPEDFPDPDVAPRVDQSELNEQNCVAKASENLFFNQAWANYAFTPVTGKTTLSTVQYKNQTSIDKSGKQVIKVIDFPFLYEETTAVDQLKEFLRFYSGGIVYVDAETAWVHLLRDLSDFVSFNYQIGSLSYDGVPMMVRDIGINLATGGVTFRLLSFANFAYASYSPANASRFLSSSSQSIVEV